MAVGRPKSEPAARSNQSIFSTFPIVEREDIAAHGRYLSRDICLAYINALAAGDPDANIEM